MDKKCSVNTAGKNFLGTVSRNCVITRRPSTEISFEIFLRFFAIARVLISKFYRYLKSFQNEKFRNAKERRQRRSEEFSKVDDGAETRAADFCRRLA